MKQTAIEYLVSKLRGLRYPQFEETEIALKIAYEMEKEQIIEAMAHAQIIESIDYFEGSVNFLHKPNQYFKETYNNE